MRLIYASIVTLTALAFLSGCGGCGRSASAESAIRKRWEREAHGRIVFVSSPASGQGHPSLCIVKVPSLEVSVESVPDSLAPSFFIGAKWTYDGHAIIFGSLQAHGVFRYDCRTGECRRITEWRSDPETYFTRSKTDSGGNPFVEYVPVRGQRWCDDYLSVGRQSGGLYSIRASTGENPRLDVMLLGSPTGDSLLFPYDGNKYRGFAVSPDERFLAFSNDTDIRIHQRMGGEWRSLPHPPEFPRLFEPGFSPDGKLLAAVGWGEPGKGPEGVATSSAPDYTKFVTLAKTGSFTPWSLCWSPDGKWILLTVWRQKEPRSAFDLVVVEVESGKWFLIPELRVRSGEKAQAVYSFGYVDWTE